MLVSSKDLVLRNIHFISYVIAFNFRKNIVNWRKVEFLEANLF
jgi:hypothetical protein